MNLNHTNDIETIIFNWIKTEKCKEPIKKNLLNFKDINKIFAVISEFPISREKYLNLIDYSNEDTMLNYFTTCFLYHMKLDIQKLFSTEEDVIKTKNFINLFFDLDYPIIDAQNDDIYWIYPKLEYKLFLASCLDNNLYEEYYVSPDAISSLVEIISAFSWSEYKDVDKSPVLDDHLINLPTLVYANIKLYEKGYINIKEVNNGFEISLDINGTNDKKPIFSKHKSRLKESIVETCNKNYKTNFTPKDIKV